MLVLTNIRMMQNGFSFTANNLTEWKQQQNNNTVVVRSMALSVQVFHPVSESQQEVLKWPVFTWYYFNHY